MSKTRRNFSAKNKTDKEIILIFLGLFLFLAIVYISFQSVGIYGGDAGDLVTAAYLRGVPHPPGYPLYTFLGNLLTKIKIKTVAYRLGFLSSLPNAAAASLIFLVITVTSGSLVAGLVGSLTLGFSYLFWLYSEVQETFALNNFFLALTIWILCRWKKTRNNRWLWLMFFIFGLSISHHHTYFLLMPAIGYWLFTNREIIFKKSQTSFKQIKNWLISLFWLILGSSFLLYLPLAAAKNPAINFGHINSIKSFWQVLTRAGYGTFKAARGASFDVYQGISSLWVYFNFLVNDFTIIGVILMLIGAFWLFRNRKNLFWFLIIGYLFLGPLFHFYACFPANSIYNLGIFERFSLSSYLILAIFLGFGIKKLGEVTEKLIQKIKPKAVDLALKVNLVTQSLFIILPIFLVFINYQKVNLSNFYGFDQYAEDLLNSAPVNSLLILVGDNTLFSSQYVHFVKNIRPDLSLVNYYQPQDNIYFDQRFAKYHQQFSTTTPGNKFLSQTIADFLPNTPILFSKPIEFENNDLEVVPYGLAYRYYWKKDQPTLQQVMEINLGLWDKIQVPSYNSPGPLYENFLFDYTLKYYDEPILYLGNYFLEKQDFEKAIFWFGKNVDRNSGSLIGLQGLAMSYSGLKQCQTAQDLIDKALKISPYSQYMNSIKAQIYRDCFGDEEKARLVEEEYKKLIERGEVLNKKVI